MTTRRASRRDESGTSAVELVLYMPLLMIAVLLAVQFCLVYLGHQVASAAAREAGRVARTTNDPAQAVAKGRQWVDDLGSGVLEDPSIDVARTGNEMVRVTVRGRAETILPWLPFGDVSETVVGPLERFVPDTGGAG